MKYFIGFFWGAAVVANIYEIFVVQDTKVKAVTHGCAVWETDSTGRTEFKWVVDE